MNSNGLAHGGFDGDGYEDIAIMTTDYSANYRLFFGSAEPSLVPVAITHTVLLKNNAESRNKFVRVKTVGGDADGSQKGRSWLSRMPDETSNTNRFVLYLAPCHQPNNFHPLD